MKEIPAVLISLLLLSGACLSLPATYDQRQEGEWNVQAHLENFLIILVPTGGFSLLDIGNPFMTIPNSFKASKRPVGVEDHREVQDEALESDEKNSVSPSSSPHLSADLAAKLAAGLDECKPGETRDAAGNCKEIIKPKRRFNGQQLSQLLPALRFGISPANRR